MAAGRPLTLTVQLTPVCQPARVYRPPNVRNSTFMQATLGLRRDALGISTVHVNRVLQDLRGDGLIRLEGGTLTVLDWEELKRVGDFDPTYLHLAYPEAA